MGHPAVRLLSVQAACFLLAGFLFAGVAAAVAGFVAFEVLGRSGMLGRGTFAAGGKSAFIAVIGMEMVVYLTMKVGRAVEPPPCADEDAAGEPLRTVVAVGSAVVGSDIVVAVGAGRLGADLDADLGVGFGSCREDEASSKGE
jgi:hypothetical protein